MTDPPEKKKRVLTPADWAEAKAEYELGRATKTDLAEKYGVGRQAMTDGLNKRGAVYGSKAKSVEDAVINAAKDQAAKRLEDIQAMKERQRQRVELIQSLAVKAITDQVKALNPIGDRKADMVVLKNAMSIVSIGRDELYHIFDLHSDPDGGDEIPEFIVSEYTEEEIAALNNQRLGVSDADLEEVAKSVDPDVDPLDGLLDDEDD